MVVGTLSLSFLTYGYGNSNIHIMIRTSILLPPVLHQQVVMTSQQEGKSVTDVIRQAVEQFIETRRKTQLKRIYDVMDQFVGKGPPGITDASSTIDEVLYGENGVWKGQDE
jgi:hypothetical protein